MERSTRNEIDYYGASYLIANNLGYPEAPIVKNSRWSHGWMFNGNFKVEYIDEIFIGIKQFENAYVWNRNVASKLRMLCSKNYILDIGAPILYGIPITKSSSVDKQKNSLLVMPGHVLKDDEIIFDVHEFMNEIGHLKKYFNHIGFCVSKNCADRKIWDDFVKKEGYDYIIGASLSDMNSLRRMGAIFSRFETMITNAWGSHIVYAGHFDCKISLFGKLQNPKFSWNDPSKDPHIFNRLKSFYEGPEVIKFFEPFVCHPCDAKNWRDWCDDQLGIDSVRTPKELQDLFKWSKFSLQFQSYKQKIKQLFKGS